jgi:signal transduction histidine kinase
MLPTVESELLVATCTPTGAIAHCNQAWRSVLGPPGSPWSRLSEEDRERTVTAVLEAAEGTLVTNQVVEAAAEEREEPLPVLLHFIPVHETGEDAVHAVTVSGEVMAEPSSWMINQTQRHRMEALGRMTMGVAHDLNNLLSGLLGHIELLREKANSEMSAEAVQSSLGTIERAAEDGAALIDKLQRYIRQDTQEHFETLDLAELVEDCITLTQPYWHNEPRREGIQIEVERNLADVPSITGSASELREVIVNLILNAVQAMPNGGTLSFETFEDPEAGVGLRVADTGTGMDDEVQEHIFEPLFTTKGEEGTGMGLAASYGIVQEHEGDIRVDSAPGRGTTFTLLFPPAAGGARPAPDPGAETVDSGVARVLVVDDEEMVRSIVTQLLSLKGHEVHRAASAAQALEMVGETRFDIVFTDFGMPEMTGAELAATIHETYPDLPVVLLTGYTETDAATGEVEAVLSKPFKLDELQATIRDLVAGRS